MPSRGWLIAIWDPDKGTKAIYSGINWIERLNISHKAPILIPNGFLACNRRINILDFRWVDGKLVAILAST